MEKKKIIKLKESDLHKIIKESVNRILNEERNPLSKIQDLIQQVMDIYNQAKQEQDGDNYPLMDREGNSYGLKGNIKLMKNGYITIPLIYELGKQEEIVKIKVFSQRQGKVVIENGDYYSEGWKDAKKILNKIIKDANISSNYFKNYDPNIEYSNNNDEYKKNKSKLQDFNIQIGRNKNAGIDYI